MKLIADENIEAEIVSTLRKAGFEVKYILEMAPGLDDRSVLNLANEQNSILLTADKDFGELIFRKGDASRGVILLRLAGLSDAKKAEMVLKSLKDHGHDMTGNFTVISHSQLRIRQGNLIRFYPRN